MSGGRKFSSDTMLSAEERLEEMERKYSVIQERIQAYDRVLNEFEVLKKETKELRSYCNFLEKLTEKESENLFAKITQISNDLDSHKKSSDSNHSEFENFRANNATNIGHLKGRLQQTELDNSLLSKQVDENLKKHENLFCVINAQGINYKKHGQILDGVQLSIDRLSSNSANLEKELSRLERKSDNDLGRFLSAIQQIPDFKDWAAKVLVKSDSDLHNVRSELNNKIDTGIENVRKELKEDPLTVDFIKKEFKKSIESLALDSKNAYLKSNNCAQQIQILEKKIENLNLTLKKYELAN